MNAKEADKIAQEFLTKRAKDEEDARIARQIKWDKQFIDAQETIMANIELRA